MEEKRIILASTSQRRVELMQSLGIKFSTIQPDYEEILPKYGNAVQIASEFATAKAESVHAKNKDAFVIGADTIPNLGSELFEKPKDVKDARRILRTLTGRTHNVVTAICIFGPQQYSDLRHAITKVTFRDCSEETIDWYIRTEEPFGRAAAYAVQGFGAALVEKVEGEYTTVVGLPLQTLEKMLQKLRTF